MNAQTITIWIKKYPVPAVCGVMICVFLGALYFRGDALVAQQTELDELSAKNARQLANISNAARLDEQMEFLAEANKAVQQRALPLGGLAQNLQYFYRLESELGIKYSDLRPGSRPNAPKNAIYVPLNYTVSFEADFNKCIEFLRRVESGAVFCRIMSAEASKGNNGVQLNVNVDLLGLP